MTTVRQTIYDLCAIAENSKVPILIVSNPGYAKTTCIKDYAEKKNYYLETLVGSRYEPTDISGYLVNEPGVSSLVHKEPTWFTRLWKAHNEGKKSLLFIDELSTCHESVQGTLLTLIFDRTIGENKLIPEDTTIISAANYSGNLNEEFDIVSPTLNRFCIFNLLDGLTSCNILKEFLTDDYLEAEVPEEEKEIDIESFNNSYKDIILNEFAKHSSSSSLGLLNLKNTDFQDLYRKNNDIILNFITGRSVSYLRRVLLSASKLSIHDNSIIGGLVDGLIGLGTGTFKEEAQLNSYRERMKNSCYILCSSNYVNSHSTIEVPSNIVDAITKYCLLYEDTSVDNFDILSFEDALAEKLKKEYGNTLDVYKSLLGNEEKKNDFCSTFEKLSTILETAQKDENRSVFCGIHQSLINFYNDITGTCLNFSSFKYGMEKPRFGTSCCLKYSAGLNKYVKIVDFGNTNIKIDFDEYPFKANLGNILVDEKNSFSIVHVL